MNNNLVFNPTKNTENLSLSIGTVTVPESQEKIEVERHPGMYYQETIYYEPVKEKRQPKKIDKDKKAEVAKNFYFYMRDLSGKSKIDLTEFKHQLDECCKYSQTTVTTQLLYAADVGGLNRPDITKAAIPILINSDYVGKLFLQTLVRGLVWQQKWKLVCEFITDDTPAKLRTFVFEAIRNGITKGNARCMQELPRQGEVANRIRGYLGMTPAEWRHTLVQGSGNSLSALMSSNNWAKIKYEDLSVYMISACYRAFARHYNARFQKYLEENEGIKKTAYRIKFHFRKHKFLKSSVILKNYFVKIAKRGRNDRYKHEKS
jgi:hypothetical protein